MKHCQAEAKARQYNATLAFKGKNEDNEQVHRIEQEETHPFHPLELRDVQLCVRGARLAGEVLRAAPWTSAARVAACFLEGRVFLAGDAAHEMPPAGGFGMNTGIQDVHNLAWKLAAVLAGWAGHALLETYEREHQPVDRWTTEQALRNLASIRRIGSEEALADTSMLESRQEFFHEQGMIFGATYESAAVRPDGTERPVMANPVTEYVPTAHPGCRAPHLWLERAGQRISTLDLFGTSFVLLAGRAGTAWCQAAADVAHARRVPLHVFTVGPHGDLVDTDGSWATTMVWSKTERCWYGQTDA